MHSKKERRKKKQYIAFDLFKFDSLFWKVCNIRVALEQRQNWQIIGFWEEDGAEDQRAKAVEEE